MRDDKSSRTGISAFSADVPRPPHLAEMIAAAGTLCGELDFVRVDFYDTADQLYFGEITTSPECAMGRFLVKGLDWHLGGHWNLPGFTKLRPALR